MAGLDASLLPSSKLPLKVGMLHVLSAEKGSEGVISLQWSRCKYWLWIRADRKGAHPQTSAQLQRMPERRFKGPGHACSDSL